ncbi:MAG: M28 family peptidase [Phycisphaeraceae bacterium]|nr:MAG: M28 family peptidase [Phycisphaeraceae bacterium]
MKNPFPMFRDRQRTTTIGALILIALWWPIIAVADEPSHRHWRPDRQEAQRELERRLLELPEPRRMRDMHELLASEPHTAGTPGDLFVIDEIASYFESLGLEVEKQELWLYLPRPVDAALEIVAPERIALPIKEKPIPGDPYSARSDTSIGWNAYSATGDVTASVVYANYGTKEDFEKLAELGVSVEGKIVIARYGRNFRGYKAKYAEQAGAAGLLIYTDPADSGYAQGAVYPEGGYANEHTIQRGSILTLPHNMDPLTPDRVATRDAERLDPDDVDFPKIPVQPIGWASAREILSRMTGEPVTERFGREWQGGLPFTYRITGGDSLRVRVMVEQERKLTRTYNVVATLRGERYPDEYVIVGSHHDAWDFGAHDPLSGTIVTLEAARCFAALADEGLRPRRSLIFGTWGAEEFGIIGSSEWVTAHSRRLTQGAIAYFNLDASTFGMNLRGSAAPSLKPLLIEAARDAISLSIELDGMEENHVEGADTARPMREQRAGLSRLGNLGGGSDHVGFYCHIGIPSASFSASGARGSIYHSLYDNLNWYQQTVGDDYEPHRMLTRVVSITMSRLANADLIPLDPVQPPIEFRMHLESIEQRARDLGMVVDFLALRTAAQEHERRARETRAMLLDALTRDELPDQTLRALNSVIISLERMWLRREGLPGRPWFRSLYASPDETSGYAAWMLPALRRAVEHTDEEALAEAQMMYLNVFRNLDRMLDAVETMVGP